MTRARTVRSKMRPQQASDDVTLIVIHNIPFFRFFLRENVDTPIIDELILQEKSRHKNKWNVTKTRSLKFVCFTWSAK